CATFDAMFQCRGLHSALPVQTGLAPRSRRLLPLCFSVERSCFAVPGVNCGRFGSGDFLAKNIPVAFCRLVLVSRLRPSLNRHYPNRNSVDCGPLSVLVLNWTNN